MSDFTIVPVRTRRERRRFVGFPYTLYRDTREWCPPLRRDQCELLDPKRHPFHAHGSVQPFLAEGRDGRILGRVAAIVNGMHLETYDDATGFFGFFDCMEREEVARGLLDAAEGWLRERGLRHIRGPVCPSMNETAGLLVEGFDRPNVIMMPYNHPYYEPLLRAHGYDRAMTMWSYFGDWHHLDLRRLARGADIARRRTPGLTLRTLDMRRYDREVDMLRSLYNATFTSVWGSVPMTEAEFRHEAKALRPVIDPRLALILEHGSEPVGYSLCVPDVNEILRHVPDGRLFPFGFLRLLLKARFHQVRLIRYILLGLLPAYQRKGLDALLVHETIEIGRRDGYLGGELGWVMDDNHVLRNAIEGIGGVVDKQFAIYGKAL